MLPNTILRETTNGFTEYSLSAVSLDKGVLTIDEQITSALSINFALLLKHMAQEQKDINIYIDSPGGEINAGLVMYDLIQDYPYGVDIYCVGIAASMSAILLAGGRKGHRFILPHSRVMIHEPLLLSGFGGSATSIEQKANYILEVKAKLNNILTKHTGKSVEEVNKATAFDNYMTAEEAIEFGICDKIANIF